MALPAVIAALGSAAIGGIISHKGAKDQRKHQTSEARRQEAFQERMSSTAYQRAMDDMRKAGLNPMLAYTQGGASTPSGAQADIEDVVEPAVSTAKQGLMVKQELDNMKARRELDLSAANRERLQGNLFGHQANLVDQQLRESQEREKFIKAQKILLQLQAPGAKNLSDLERTRLGKVAPYIERILKMIGSGTGTAIRAASALR